jgi:hypothetical protein
MTRDWLSPPRWFACTCGFELESTGDLHLPCYTHHGCGGTFRQVVKLQVVP